MSTEIQIYTIGHSSHPLGSFLWLLRKHRIEALVDIRRYPGSRRHPHFSKESLSLSASLLEEDIEYRWLEALGGHRTGAKDAPPSPNRGVEDESFRNYAEYMATDDFRQGVAKLPAIAGNRRTAIMCAEGDYRHCHRRFLCDHLLANGVTVLHILPTAEVKPHRLTPGAKVVEGTVTYPGQPTLFDVG
jgi:uncharacterized protein (DUF488 family)